MKKGQGATVQKKNKTQFLKRQNPVMIRFDDAELKDFNQRSKKAGLSRAEYGRRRILEIPIAEIK